MILKAICTLFDYAYRAYRKYIKPVFYKCRLGYCGKNVSLQLSKNISTEVLSRMFLYDNTGLKNPKIISYSGKLIMMRNSGAAEGLTVITGNHGRRLGHWFTEDAHNRILDIEKDVIIEEDVWIGANVTLMAGVRIGRGATISACACVYKSVPPYSIVQGNPAKVIGFYFTPEEIIKHEMALYPPNERIGYSTLIGNFNDYFRTSANDA